MPKKSISFKTLLAISFVVLSWSSAFVFIREGLHGYSPGPLALFRYLIVSSIMLIFYLQLPTRSTLTFKQLFQLFLLGFFGIGLYMIALNYGEKTVSASIASFIIGINPIVSMLWAMIFFHERVSPKSWLGVVVSVIGLAIIATAKLNHGIIDHGVFAVLFAVICGGIYNVAQKPLLKTLHPIEVAAISAWAGTLAMLVFMPSLLHEIPLAPWQTTGSVIYLGVIPGAIGYLSWSYAISSNQIPASKIVLSLYMLPLFATLLGWLILGEMPSMMELIGGCICLFGALIATRY